MQHKSKIVIFILFLLILLVVLPVLSSVFIQFIDRVTLNPSLISASILTETLKNPKTYIDFFSKINPPNILCWSAIAIYVVCSLLGFLSTKNQNKYSRQDKYGSHGTSRFQNPKEIRNNYFRDKSGWFLGSNIPHLSYHIGMNGAYHPINGSLNMQIAVFGSPGSFKTTAFVLPNIFHIPFIYKNLPEKADIIITDPKCEIYSLTARYLESQNYEVRLLDF